MKTALTVENLSFAYGKKKALNHINFTLQSGECTVLLGPNGAGKSTLFSLITRLYDTHQGQIHLCGFDIKKQSRQALMRLGVVYQQTTLDIDLTVLQNLRYHLALHGISRKQGNKRIQEELERLNMYERRHEKIRQLNGGHKRRVEIARALLHNPSLLLLDEPTVGLDVPSRKSIVEHIHQLANNRALSVLWASHLIDEIYPEDQLLILHQGEIKASGSINHILLKTETDCISAAFYKLTQGAEK
ncbi:MAG: ATP-binding cassette domain-containing protein [Methylococcales bacterium]|nr:ATP-binding cassette domain-containing protein [Methylococcales bacterium]